MAILKDGSICGRPATYLNARHRTFVCTRHRPDAARELLDKVRREEGKDDPPPIVKALAELTMLERQYQALGEENPFSRALVEATLRLSPEQSTQVDAEVWWLMQADEYLRCTVTGEPLKLNDDGEIIPAE